MLVVSITDNGKGISPDRLLTLKREMNGKKISFGRKSHGLGLRNVNLRIKSEYGENTVLTVESYCRTSVRCKMQF